MAKKKPGSKMPMPPPLPAASEKPRKPRGGRFVLSGGPEVADRLEKTGYSEWGKEEAAQHAHPQEVA